MIIPLILLFCLAAGLSFIKFERKAEWFVFILFGGLLFLTAAFRDGDAVRDYAIYMEMYESASEFDVEISFSIIVWLVKHLFSDNVIFLFVIYAILGVFLKFKAIKTLTPFVFLSVLLYISNFYILHELIQIRTGVSTGFLLLCIKPVYERNWKHFILFAALAILFHYSAIVILPLWFLSGKSINKKFWIGIIIGVYILHFSGIKFSSLLNLIPFEIVSPRISIYQALAIDNQLGALNVFSAQRMIYLLVALLLVWKISIVRGKNEYAILLTKIFIISIITFVAFSDIPYFAFRISELFGIVEIILIPLIVYVFRPRIIGKAAVISIASALFFLTVFYAKIIL